MSLGFGKPYTGNGPHVQLALRQPLCTSPPCFKNGLASNYFSPACRRACVAAVGHTSACSVSRRWSMASASRSGLAATAAASIAELNTQQMKSDQ